MTRRLAGTVLGAAGLIAVLTLLSRLVGFLRWIVHSWMLHGESATAGAYAAANQIPNVLFEVAAGGALASVVIPLLAAPLARHLREDVSRVASALLTWAMIVLIPLALVVVLGADLIAALLPSPAGLDPQAAREMAALIATFLRVFAVQIPFYGVAIVLTGVLQAHKRFFWPAVAPLISSVVVIGVYFLFGALADGNQDHPAALSTLAIAVLSWGTTAGVLAMALVQVVPVLRLGVRFRPVLRFAESRRALRLAGAGLGALMAQQLAVLTVVVLAPAGGDPGTLAVFQYAQAVYLLPYAVFAVPLATALFPRLAEAASTDSAEFRRLTESSTRLVLVVGASGAAILFADAFTAPALFRVSDALAHGVAYFAPGVIGWSLVFHLSRVLYTIDRGRTAVLATAGGWAVVVLASVILVRLWAPDGADPVATISALALANSLGMTVAGLALLAGIRVAAPGVSYGRTLVVSLLGATAGALLGRWAAGAVLDALPDGVLGSVIAAIPGALIALLLTLGAVGVADRSTLRGIGRR